MGPMLMLDLCSGAVMLKYLDIQVVEDKKSSPSMSSSWRAWVQTRVAMLKKLQAFRVLAYP
jgi:hypothetical protein